MPRRRPAANTKVDRAELHRYLFKKAGGKKLRIVNRELAAALHLEHNHMGRILREMVEAGRIIPRESTRNRVRMYDIVDPEVFDEQGKQPRKRVIKWQ